MCWRPDLRRQPQFAFRTSAKLGGRDVSLSYYHGRFGVPGARLVGGHRLGEQQHCADDAGVSQSFDVIGVEMAGSIQRLGGLGYWIEAAVNIPTEIGWESTTPSPARQPAASGEYQRDPATGRYLRVTFSPDQQVTRPVVVVGTPFVKATIGVDYTIGSRAYINVQYVHGFIDGFGAGRAARRVTTRSTSARIRASSRA